jgi:hypothetical protein
VGTIGYPDEPLVQGTRQLGQRTAESPCDMFASPLRTALLIELSDAVEIL